MTMNPPLHKGNTRGTRLPIDVLSAADIRALIAAANPKTKTGVRLRAIVALGWGSGLRPFELLAIREVDLLFDDPEGPKVAVQWPKGDKVGHRRNRTAHLMPDAVRFVEAWRRVRARELPEATETDPLFLTFTGEAMTTKALRYSLPKLAERAGISKRVHGHGLRRAHASHLHNVAGWSLYDVQRQLGHASPTTTTRYIATDSQRLGRLMAALPPTLGVEAGI